MFEDQVRFKGEWSETKSTAYINHHLIQAETYHDLVADGPVDKRIFEPSMIGK